MRARRLELRLIGLALVAAWGLAAGAVLLTYRPGGPLDVVVGITMLLPLAIASVAVAWPPVARGGATYPLIVSMGVGALLLLLPSIGGVINQLQALGSQTLLPSFEAAYPWLLALIGTSLFTGFGIARRLERGTAVRGRRLRVGVAVAAALTLASGTAFGGAAVANELALRDPANSPSSSRFGPTDAQPEPAPCDERLMAGPSARLAGRLTGHIDTRSIGSIEMSGTRNGSDFRWLAYVATFRELGQYGMARVGERGWARTPADGWESVAPRVVRDGSLDLQAVRTALTFGARATAEDRGVEVIEGARARRCRVAVDGPVFREAFPQTRWLVGEADLAKWRGQLDYWMFLDGQVGQIAGSVNGEASGIRADAIQGTLEIFLTAVSRGRDFVVYPPGP